MHAIKLLTARLTQTSRLPVVAVLIATMTTASHAQLPPPQQTEQPPSTAGAAPEPGPPSSEANKTQSLSKQLEQGEGVIAPPPGIDPHLKKPTPEDFKSDMPIIPPPGEPGGDQTVQPK